MSDSGSELFDETVGPLLVIVEGPANLSPNDFDSVGGSLLNCTIQFAPQHWKCRYAPVAKHQDTASSRGSSPEVARWSNRHEFRSYENEKMRSSNSIIRSLIAKVSRVKTALGGLRIGDPSLTGDVTQMLLLIMLAPHLSLSKIPHIADLVLERLGDVCDTVPENLEVSLGVGHTLRDRSDGSGAEASP